MTQRAARLASQSDRSWSARPAITLAWSVHWATYPLRTNRSTPSTTRLPDLAGNSKRPVGTPEVAASQTMDMLSGVTQTAREADN